MDDDEVRKRKQGAAMLMQFLSATVSGLPELEDSLDDTENMLYLVAD